MSNTFDNILDVLEILGRRYIQEILFKDGWDCSQLRSDWFYAFKFLLSKLYFQGRNDKLSELFLRNMMDCLNSYFLPNSTTKLEALLQYHHIPINHDWANFNKVNSLIWQQFDKSMGKQRDREMVIDALGYIINIPSYNIVNHSIIEIESRRIRHHRDELKQIMGVGAKTSALYLRDIIFIFNCHLEQNESLEIQPIDTWVDQVVNSLRGDKDSDQKIRTEDWLNQLNRSPFNSALINAGMWYLGKYSRRLILSLLAEGKISPEMVEK